MATLTTSWVTYASASYSSGSATIKFSLQAKYSTQSTTNNTTTIQTRLRSDFTSGSSLSGAGYKFTCSYASTVSGSGVWYFADEVITSGSSTITHNNDGTKSISLSASAYNKYWNFTKNLSATVSLPKIDRLATVTTATDFNDESQPTITFSNSGGFQLAPYLNFFTVKGTGVRVYQLVRSKGNITSPYTWTFTDAERTAIRNACNGQTTYYVTEGLDTYSGNTKLGSNSIGKTFTIINATPTMTYTKTENNSDAISYLGSSSATTVIKNISNVTIAVTPTTLKGATINSVVINHNGVNQTVTESSGVYSATFNITGDTTTITVKDSRGLTVSSTYEPTVIEYERVKQNSFSFKRVSPTSADVDLLVDSVYYQQTFGSTPNVPTVKYKIGESGTEVTVPSNEYSIDTENNKLTIEYTIEDAINYRDSDTFYIEVSDLLSSWTNNNKITKGIPVFEFGDDEVQVNGDLLLADVDRDNVINVREALSGGGGGTSDYTQLTNKPQINGNTLTGNMSTSDIGITIPTVNNATLTIQKNGTTVNTFTANASSNVTANITVPTQTSDLTNNSGFIDNTVNNLTNYTLSSALSTVATSGSYNDLSNTPTIPTVNNGKLTFYKNNAKVTDFTANSSTNVTVDLTNNVDDVQINGTSILSSRNADIKTYGTYNASTNKIATMSDLPTVPTNVSSFTNDAGYTTNTGTITSVKMNGSTVASSGEADLGTVITSHQNIKTINNTSLVGTGDVSVQPTLVSGTNIKTINGTSLLGSGDISVGGGGTSTDVKINGTSITSGGEADIQTYGTYNSSTNKIATMSDLPSVPVTDVQMNGISILSSGVANIYTSGSISQLNPLASDNALGVQTGIYPQQNGNWSSSNTYKKGQLATYLGKLYRNKTATNTSTTPSSDTTNWENITFYDSVYDTGWINITATKGTWSILRYRVIGKTVHIEGNASSFKWSGSGGDSIKDSAIPSEYCPPNWSRHFIVRTSGSRLCNFYVTTAGNIGVDYIINVSNGSNYTTATGIDFQVSYLID